MMYSYRIVAIGDIHVELNLLNLAFEWISKNSIDAVIQTGDICNARLLPKDANLAQILNQADSTFDIFKSSNKLINFVPGNHDPIEIGSKYVSDTIINRHSNSGYLFNYKITGIGGSHSVPSQLIGKTVPFIESSLDHIYDLADLDYVGKRIIDDFEYYIHSDIIKNYDYLFPCDILITHTPALIE
ncbi:MAG: metallophosphoesterase, partial [Candidatus Heimdallarchaeota archaeon]|nr:metallophosphoesterase [Candidatus Heimdallarchaeota archaeon]